MLQLVTILVIALLTAADQIIKVIVLEHLKPIGSYCLINNFLSLTYVENTGAAFGSFDSHTAVLSIITAVVLVVGLFYLLTGKAPSKLIHGCVTVIVAGGLANLIDRVFRGFVIDYISADFIDFPVFNFADILVTCGSFFLAALLIHDIIKESGRKKAEKGENVDE